MAMRWRLIPVYQWNPAGPQAWDQCGWCGALGVPFREGLGSLCGRCYSDVQVYQQTLEVMRGWRLFLPYLQQPNGGPR